MKRFLSFMLGLIFGIVFLLGAFGLAVYSSVTVVHPNEIYADIENYLGDLGDVSLLQAYYNILALYQANTGNLATDKFYSIGDFLADNHISTTNAETGEVTAFGGVVLPKELLDAPLFEYFNGQVDENGHTGVQRALKQIKLSSVPAVVNTFAPPTEDGSQTIDPAVIEELDKHTMYNLVYGYDDQTNTGDDTAQVNIVANLSRILENITLANILPMFRENTDTENQIGKLLLAVGQAPIGRVIADLTGNKSIFGMLTADGALSAVGQLTFTDFLGSSDPLISSLVGDLCIADFVDENGNILLVDALNGVSLAGLLGMVRRQVTELTVAEENTTVFCQTNEDGSQGEYIYSLGEVDGKLYISTDEQNDGVATTWYEAQCICSDDTHTEELHTSDCYDYVWYKKCEVADDTHDHVAEGEIQLSEGEDADYYAPVYKTSIWFTVAQLKAGSLFDENGAFNLGNLIAKFDSHSLSAIVNELLKGNDMLSKMADLLDLDEMTLSDLLAEGGFDTLINKVMDAPIADLLGAFGSTEGMQSILDMLGDMSINDLMGGGFQDIELCGILGLIKRPMDVTSYTATPVDFTKTNEDGSITYVASVLTAFDTTLDKDCYFISTNYGNLSDDESAIWYEASLDCKDSSHGENHTLDCYDYVFYQECTDTEHVHTDVDVNIPTTDEEGNTTDRYCVTASGLFAILGSFTVGSLMNGGIDSLLTEFTSMTLGELFELFKKGKLDGILGALSDMTITELTQGGYEKLTLGSLLGYVKNPQSVDISAMESFSELVTGDGTDTFLLGVATATTGEIYLTADEGEPRQFYLGKLSCDNEEHTNVHNEDCYEYLWYQPCEEGCEHKASDHVTIDGKNHTLAGGIFGALVDLTIGDITNGSNLMDKVFNIKLGDLLEGQAMDGLIATLADYTLKDLMNPDTLKELGIADILGFARLPIADTTGYVAVAGMVNLYQKGDDFAISQTVDNITTLYQAHLTCKLYHQHDESCGGIDVCKLTEHTTHNADCYGYVWYQKCEKTGCEHTHVTINDLAYAPVDALYGVLADLTIGSLMGGEDIMTIITNRLTLGEVLKTGLPEILQSVANIPISQLSGKIDTIKVGELLGYTYNQSLSQWEKEIDGVAVAISGIEKVIADKTINDLSDFNAILQDVKLGDVLDPMPAMLSKLKDTAIGELATAIDTLVLGDFLEYVLHEETTYTCNDDHEHTQDCATQTVQTWYKDCATVNCTYVSWDEHETNDALGHYVEVTDITKKLAGKTINDLKNFDSILSELTLGDVMQDIPPMLSSLKDTYITQLGDTIKTITVADFFGYVEQTEANYICEEDHEHTEACAIENLQVWYEKCTEGEGCQKHAQHKNITVDGVEDKYGKVTGISAKLAGKTIDQLSDIGNMVLDFTLLDVFGSMDKVPSILQSLANSKISELNNDIQNVYLGEFLGYTKGDQLAEDKYTCGHTASEAHDESCQHHPAFKWLDSSSNEVVGITAKLANEKVSTLTNIGATIKTYTLSDVLGDDIPAMLKSLENTPIGELSTKLYDLRLGDVMGYTTKEVDAELWSSVAEGLEARTDGASYALPLTTNGETTWYEATMICDGATPHTDDCFDLVWYEYTCGSQHTHLASCATQAVTDNVMKKLASLTVGSMSSGLKDTINTFTISDFITVDETSPKILQTLKDVQIANLSTAMSTVKLGEVIDITDNSAKILRSLKDTPVDQFGNKFNDMTMADVLEPSGNVLLEELCNYKINDMGNAMTNMYAGTAMGYERWLVCESEDAEHTHTDEDHCYFEVDGRVAWYELDCHAEAGDDVHSVACYTDEARVKAPQAAFVNSKITEIGDDVNNVVLGDLITDTSSPILTKLKDTTVGNLGSAMNDLTLGDVVTDTSNPMLNSLKDTKITEMGNALNDMYVGTAMGYMRKVVTTTANAWSATAFDDVKASSADPDTAEYARKVNDVWYEANFTCTKEGHTHTSDCYGFVWYECTDTTEGHEHTDCYTTVVGGLNGKMSNLKITNISSGLSDIIASLTLKDMRDSGVLSEEGFSDNSENAYKLAIIYCSSCPDHVTDTEGNIIAHKFTDTLSGQAFECNLQGYFYCQFVFQGTSRTISACEFYLRAQGVEESIAKQIASVNAEQRDAKMKELLSVDVYNKIVKHRNEWYTHQFSEFISTLMGAL